MKIAIIAALPQEISGVIKNLKAKKDRGKHPLDIYRSSHDSSEVFIAVTGMGLARAESAAKYVLLEFRPDLVISAGYGGALYEGAEIGDLVWGYEFFSIPDFSKANLISAEKIIFDKFSAEIPVKKGSILTLPELINKAGLLKSIPDSIPNPVCDMETFALARACIQNGVRFIAIRSISDLKDEDIPSELFTISDESGNYSIFTAIRIFISKPSLLPIAIRLGTNSQKATKSLTLAIEKLLKIIP